MNTIRLWGGYIFSFTHFFFGHSFQPYFFLAESKPARVLVLNQAAEINSGVSWRDID